MSDTHCVKCGKAFAPSTYYDIAKTKPVDTGYGENSKGERTCYACIGEADKAELIATGRMIGYYEAQHVRVHGRYLLGDYAMERGTFGNWPGTFKVDVPSGKRSINNFGAERIDFWFRFESALYWGLCVGDTQIARVRRVKG